MKAKKVGFLFLLFFQGIFAQETFQYKRSVSLKIEIINNYCSEFYKENEKHRNISFESRVREVMSSTVLGGVIERCITKIVAPYISSLLTDRKMETISSFVTSLLKQSYLVKKFSGRNYPINVMTKNIKNINDFEIKRWVFENKGQAIDEKTLKSFCIKNEGMMLINGKLPSDFNYYDRAFKPFEKKLLDISQTNEQIVCALDNILKKNDDFGRKSIGYFLVERKENRPLLEYLKNRLDISHTTDRKCKFDKKIKEVLYGFITENIYKDNLSVNLDGKTYNAIFYKGEKGHFIERKSYASINDKGKLVHVKEHVSNLGVVIDEKGRPVIFRSGRSENSSRIDELIRFINTKNLKYVNNERNKNILLLSLLDFSKVKLLIDDERHFLKSMVSNIYHQTRLDRDNAPLFMNFIFSDLANANTAISNIHDLERANLLGYYRLFKMLANVSGKHSMGMKLLEKRTSYMIGEILDKKDIFKINRNELKDHLSCLDDLIKEALNEVSDRETKKAFSALGHLITHRIDEHRMTPYEKFLDLHFISTFLNKKGVHLPLTVQCKSGVDRTGEAVALSVASKDKEGNILTAQDILENPPSFESFRFRFEKAAKFLALPVGVYTRGEAGLKWKSHPIPLKLLSAPHVNSQGKWTKEGKKNWLF